MLSAIVGVLSALGSIIPALRTKAELARIGRYYATESMLVWDEGSQRYDPHATPEYGTETLREYFGKVVAGEAREELGDHAVFERRRDGR